MNLIKDRTIDYLEIVWGGDAWEGQDLFILHAQLHITTPVFNQVMKLCTKVVKQMKFPSDVQKDILAEMEVMREPITDADGKFHKWVADKQEEMEAKTLEGGAIDPYGMGFTMSIAEYEKMVAKEKAAEERKKRMAAARAAREADKNPVESPKQKEELKKEDKKKREGKKKNDAGAQEAPGKAKTEPAEESGKPKKQAATAPGKEAESPKSEKKLRQKSGESTAKVTDEAKALPALPQEYALPEEFEFACIQESFPTKMPGGVSNLSLVTLSEQSTNSNPSDHASSGCIELEPLCDEKASPEAECQLEA